MKFLKALFLTLGLALFCGVASAQINPILQLVPQATALQNIANSTNISTASSPVVIRGANRDVTLWLFSKGASGTGPSNSVAAFDVSPDGTNWTTTLPFGLTNTLNGNTNVGSFVNVSRTNLAGAMYLRLDKTSTSQVTGAVTNSIYVTFDP